MEIGWDNAERELLERIESVRARERELVESRAQLARRLADLDKRTRNRRDDQKLTEHEQQLTAREEELEAKLAAAEQREREAASKLALAIAEREELDERERAVKDLERELAGQRRRLHEEHAALPTVAPPRASGCGTVWDVGKDVLTRQGRKEASTSITRCRSRVLSLPRHGESSRVSEGWPWLAERRGRSARTAHGR